MISEDTRQAMIKSYINLKELGYSYQCRKLCYRDVSVFCPCCCESLDEYVFEGSMATYKL